MGPQEQRLHHAVAGMSVAQVRTAAYDWQDGATVLRNVATALEDCGPDIEKNFGGATADAAKEAFAKVTERVRFRAEQMRAAGTALDNAGDAMYYAESVKGSMGAFPSKPAEPTTSPTDDEVTALKKQAAYGRQMQTYNTQTAERESTAQRTADHLDTVLNQSTETMKQVHGEPDPVRTTSTSSGGGGTGPGSTAPGGRVPMPTGPHVWTGDTTTDPHWVPHTGHHHTPTVVVTDPGGTDTDPGTGPGAYPPTGPHPGSGGPQGPSGPTVPVPTGPGAGTPGGAPGGVTAPTLGGVAGALGGGALGGLAGVGGAVRGPSVLPGTMSTGGASGAGVRSIGSTTRTGTTGALGRGSSTGAAGRGTGARGTGGASGRAGSKAGSRAGRAGGRGAATGAGRGGRGKKDEERRDDEFLLEEQDWVDDEGVAPDVLH